MSASLIEEGLSGKRISVELSSIFMRERRREQQIRINQREKIRGLSASHPPNQTPLTFGHHFEKVYTVVCLGELIVLSVFTKLFSVSLTLEMFHPVRGSTLDADKGALLMSLSQQTQRLLVNSSHKSLIQWKGSLLTMSLYED